MYCSLQGSWGCRLLSSCHSGGAAESFAADSVLGLEGHPIQEEFEPPELVCWGECWSEFPFQVILWESCCDAAASQCRRWEVTTRARVLLPLPVIGIRATIWLHCQLITCINALSNTASLLVGVELVGVVPLQHSSFKWIKYPTQAIPGAHTTTCSAW